MINATGMYLLYLYEFNKAYDCTFQVVASMLATKQQLQTQLKHQSDILPL